jgi:hypothetical protein
MRLPSSFWGIYTHSSGEGRDIELSVRYRMRSQQLLNLSTQRFVPGAGIGQKGSGRRRAQAQPQTASSK